MTRFRISRPGPARRPTRRARWAVAAVGVGAVLAAAVPASQAVAFFSSPLFLDVRVDSPAHLVAKGVAVNVQVEVTCGGGQWAQVDVTVSENVAHSVAGGDGSAAVWCNGHRQLMTVPVYAYVGSKSFVTGQALARAEIFGCTRTFCGSENDTRTVRIRR